MMIQGLLLVMALSRPAGAADPTGPQSLASPVFALSAFNPLPTTGFLPQIQALNLWCQMPDAHNLMDKLAARDKVTLNAVLALSLMEASAPEPGLLTPLILSANQAGIFGRLNQNIRNLAGHAPRDADGQKLFAEIIQDLAKAQAAALPVVEEALRTIAAGYKSADSAPTLAELQATRRLLAPLSRLYQLPGGSRSSLGSLAKTLGALEHERLRQAADLAFEPPQANLPTWLEPLPAPAPGEPNIADILASKKFPELALPTREDIIEFGGIKTQRVVFPNVPNGSGSDVPKLLAAGNAASEFTQIVIYQHKLDEDVDSILAGLKRGKKFELIIDYKQLFPEKWTKAAGLEVMLKNAARSPQLQRLVDASRSHAPNLMIYVLKGLGKIGINHNKLRLWLMRAANGNPRLVLQSGAFNYTLSSQKNHWENVFFIDDQRIAALFQKYFAWMKSLARPFSENLEPEEPVITTPIPRDEDLLQRFHEIPMPLASFSPNGGTMDWWRVMVQHAAKDLLFNEFGFYPTPELMEDMLSRLAKNLSLRMIIDYGQAHSPASLAALKRLAEAGAQIKLISGPHETPWTPGQVHDSSEMNHNKIVLADAHDIGGIAEAGSANISANAALKSFENAVYLTGVYLALLRDFSEALLQAGFIPDFSSMERKIQ